MTTIGIRISVTKWCHKARHHVTVILAVPVAIINKELRVVKWICTPSHPGLGPSSSALCLVGWQAVPEPYGTGAACHGPGSCSCPIPRSPVLGEPCCPVLHWPNWPFLCSCSYCCWCMIGLLFKVFLDWSRNFIMTYKGNKYFYGYMYLKYILCLLVLQLFCFLILFSLWDT